MAPTARAGARPEAIPSNDLPALILARLRAWDDDDNPALRAARIQELDRLVSNADPFEILQALPSNLTGYALALPSLRQKLMSDPPAALNWMSSHPNAQSQLLTLLHDWPQTNREAMQQFLSSLPEGSWREKVISTAANEALSTDPVAAITLAIQMQPGPQQTAWLEMAVKDWAQSDPDGAYQWASQVTDPGLREQFIGSLAVGAANADPSPAADFAVRALPPGSALNGSVSEIVWTWALQDPAGAGAWLSQLPDGDLRQAALASLLNVWGNHDAEAATAWVEEMPPGPGQIQAARQLLSALPAQPSR